MPDCGPATSTSTSRTCLGSLGAGGAPGAVGCGSAFGATNIRVKSPTPAGSAGASTLFGGSACGAGGAAAPLPNNRSNSASFSASVGKFDSGFNELTADCSFGGCLSSTGGVVAFSLFGTRVGGSSALLGLCFACTGVGGAAPPNNVSNSSIFSVGFVGAAAGSCDAEGAGGTAIFPNVGGPGGVFEASADA